jgi:hypothetical protein
LVSAGGGRRARGGGVGENVCAEGGESAGHYRVARVSLGKSRPTGVRRREEARQARFGKKGFWNILKCWVYEDLGTLSTYATVSSDTDSFADPILSFSYVLILSTVVVLFLCFVKDGVVSGGH